MHEIPDTSASPRLASVSGDAARCTLPSGIRFCRVRPTGPQLPINAITPGRHSEGQACSRRSRPASAANRRQPLRSAANQRKDGHKTMRSRGRMVTHGHAWSRMVTDGLKDSRLSRSASLHGPAGATMGGLPGRFPGVLLWQLCLGAQACCCAWS